MIERNPDGKSVLCLHRILFRRFYARSSNVGYKPGFTVAQHLNLACTMPPRLRGPRSKAIAVIENEGLESTPDESIPHSASLGRFVFRVDHVLTPHRLVGLGQAAVALSLLMVVVLTAVRWGGIERDNEWAERYDWDGGKGANTLVGADTVTRTRESAISGDPAAQLQLGHYFRNGNGVEKDSVEATRLYRAAATSPDEGRAVQSARYWYGQMLVNGDGVEQNSELAAVHLERAATAGHVPAQWLLGELLLHGTGVPANVDAAERWFRAAAEAGYPHAMSSLGDVYEFKRGDITTAVEWYQKAADQDFAEAQFSLGLLYLAGDKVSQDHAEAARCFTLARANGDPRSAYNLGMMYRLGTGVARDLPRAVELFREVATSDVFPDSDRVGSHMNARYWLGHMYEAGEGVPKNLRHAAKWYALAARQGQTDAQFRLGRLYVLGEVDQTMQMDVRLQKGKAWLKKAIKQGNEDAKAFAKELEAAEQRALDKVQQGSGTAAV